MLRHSWRIISFSRSKHRYIFCLALQDPSNPPSISDFPPLAKLPTSANSEDIKDRSGFHLEQYLIDKGMKVVGVTFIKVRPDLTEGLVGNATWSGEAAINKALGR
jgi:hypothetical protein